MTAPANQTLAVTQADRDAAEYFGAAVGYPDADPCGDVLRQAFARHREAGQAELLEAAQEFLEFFENNADDLAIGEEIRLQEKLRAAIAKARGGAA